MVTDSCSNGDSIDYAFFDDAAGVAWPGGANVYNATLGQSYQWSLACKTGDMICIGGQDAHDSNAIYGVGLTDNPACAGGACCFICGPGAPAVFTFGC